MALTVGTFGVVFGKHVLRSDRVVNIRDVLRSDGQQVRVQGAAVREIVTGRNLVLFVAIDERLKPVAHPPGTARGAGDSPRGSSRS